MITRKAMHVEARLRNHCFRRKVIRITYFSVCVCARARARARKRETVRVGASECLCVREWV